MQSKKRENNLCELPKDLLHLMLSFLTPKPIYALRLTCHFFANFHSILIAIQKDKIARTLIYQDVLFHFSCQHIRLTSLLSPFSSIKVSISHRLSAEEYITQGIIGKSFYAVLTNANHIFLVIKTIGSTYMAPTCIKIDKNLYIKNKHTTITTLFTYPTFDDLFFITNQGELFGLSLLSTHPAQYTIQQLPNFHAQLTIKKITLSSNCIQLHLSNTDIYFIHQYDKLSGQFTYRNKDKSHQLFKRLKSHHHPEERQRLHVDGGYNHPPPTHPTAILSNNGCFAAFKTNIGQFFLTTSGEIKL
jgi:hypothetical protein